MKSDALITLDDIAEVTDTCRKRPWLAQLESLMQREPALRIVISRHRSAILQLLQAHRLPEDQLHVIDQHLHAMAGISLSLLERGHRRLWNELLPDFTNKETKND